MALIAVALAGTVFAAVHHAEAVAQRVEEAAGLARDTVFAAVMIILNGIIGLCCGFSCAQRLRRYD